MDNMTMITLTETMGKFRDLVLNEKWDTKMNTPVSKKGMFKGKSQEELKSSLSAAKKRAASLRKQGEKEPASLKTKIKELEFALRAKHSFGKVSESFPRHELSVTNISDVDRIRRSLIKYGYDKDFVQKGLHFIEEKLGDNWCHKNERELTKFLPTLVSYLNSIKGLYGISHLDDAADDMLFLFHKENTLGNYSQEKLGESLLQESAHHSLEAILQKYPLDVDTFIENGFDMMGTSKEFQYAMYEYYVKDMPYGTAKGRTGDPDEFISEHLSKYLEDNGLLPDAEVVHPSVSPFALGEGKTMRKCKGKGCDKKCYDGKEFCGKACAAKAKIKEGYSLNESEAECRFCNNVIPTGEKFCNKKCRNAYAEQAEEPQKKKVKEGTYAPGPFSKSGSIKEDNAVGAFFNGLRNGKPSSPRVRSWGGTIPDTDTSNMDPNHTDVYHDEFDNVVSKDEHDKILQSWRNNGNVPVKRNNPISEAKTKSCNLCSGSGKEGKVTCSHCNGKGKVSSNCKLSPKK
jgi:hypothetical protein